MWNVKVIILLDNKLILKLRITLHNDYYIHYENVLLPEKLDSYNYKCLT